MKYLLNLFLLVSSIPLFGQVIVDFTDPNTLTYGTDAQIIINVNGADVAMMWGGNAKNDDNYVRVKPLIFPPPGLVSDITYILNNILNGDPDATFIGYSPGDINMDGKVRVKPLIFPPPGIPSDATFILDQVLNGNSDLTRQGQN